MVHMKNVTREELLKQLIRKMAPPLGEYMPDNRLISHSHFIPSRSPMGRSAQHQPLAPKAPGCARKRDARVFLQIQ